MLQSKTEKPVEIVAGPGETVSGARITAFESGVRLVTGDIGWDGRHDEPLCTTFWEAYRARQIAYALLLAADATDRARDDIREQKRREAGRIQSLAAIKRDLFDRKSDWRRDMENRPIHSAIASEVPAAEIEHVDIPVLAEGGVIEGDKTGRQFIDVDGLISDIHAGNALDVETARILRHRIDLALR